MALQTLLSFYGLYPSKAELKADLPKHSFGNLITELGIYLEDKGFQTKLITNKSAKPLSRILAESLKDYEKIGAVENRSPNFTDINNQPFIVNVDWYKIKGSSIHRVPHYIVGLKENNFIWLYDGSNFRKKIKIDFEKLYKPSLNINRHGENGMWLLVE